MERQKTEMSKFSYHYEDPLCLSKVESAIRTMLKTHQVEESQTIVYLCVGTDRATGDCLGPLVGTRLKTLLPSVTVFGTLEEPAHAANLREVMAHMERTCPNPFIIAVDASLGNSDRVGFININRGCLKPGTALKKVLPEVGDFHISGVVNVGGYLEYMVLQNTRLHTVYRMAEIIARSLFVAHLRYRDHLKPLALDVSPSQAGAR